MIVGGDSTRMGIFCFFFLFTNFQSNTNRGSITVLQINFVFCAAALLIIDRNVSHERAVCSGIPLSMISVYWAEVIH